MDPRVVQLEEKVAHLERYVSELDGVVREMNARMDHFAREAKALRALVDAGRDGGEAGDGGGGDGADDDLRDERPPHW